MITLGTCDSNVTENECSLYQERLEKITRVPLKDIKNGHDKLTFRLRARDASAPMSVADVQQSLRDIGFFPLAEVDSICGYRTLSAIRLFQEYVRTIEKKPCKPDGLFGSVSQEHLNRWLDKGIKPAWVPTTEQWLAGTLQPGEYTRWLSLLTEVRKKYLSAPNEVLEMVNDFGGAADTKKVAQWDFDPGLIHLIGIRRGEASGKFDDIFVLLLKGMVFKFQGSTEPGHSSNPLGTPFLVQGQHDYHFGWHQRRYLALRPQRDGVLVVRSKSDKKLDAGDLANGLEPNGTINIHWGGIGGIRDVRKWSEGCQVINGALYINHDNEFVSCTDFVDINNTAVAKKAGGSRGAYNVLLDLITALSGDMTSSTVKYMLLNEEDLDLDIELSRQLATARAEAAKLMR